MMMTIITIIYEKFYQLVTVTCKAVVTYFNKYINKTPLYTNNILLLLLSFFFFGKYMK